MGEEAAVRDAGELREHWLGKKTTSCVRLRRQWSKGLAVHCQSKEMKESRMKFMLLT